jgi:hypothetical protein
MWAWALLTDGSPGDGPVVVHIFGTLTACKEGTTDAWRRIAAFARSALRARFGERVEVEYHDLFSSEMDRFPEVLALMAGGQGRIPLVSVGKELLSSGGNVSIPDMRRRLESLSLQTQQRKEAGSS